MKLELNLPEAEIDTLRETINYMIEDVEDTLQWWEGEEDRSNMLQQLGRLRYIHYELVAAIERAGQ